MSDPDPGQGVFDWMMTGPAPKGVGLAVSGGGDSMAMLHMLGPRLKGGGIPVAVATVDHGLRPEAAAEAAVVARTCAGLDLPHDTLRWTGWEGRGNLAAAARDARYRLLAGWAGGRGFDTVALAHTMDDQAETLLMRLARGSGVDGLSGMARERRAEGIRWLRPLLHIHRADLRDWMTQRGHFWVEDPSNHDPAYDRVRVRQALAVLADLGITADALASTAQRLSLAHNALRRVAAEAAERLAETRAGVVILDSARMRGLPDETQLRLIADGLRWVSSSPYRPRMTALQPAHAAVMAGRSTTLHGCILIGTKDRILIAREPRAAAGLETPTTALWDSRWRLDGPHAPGLTIRAIGAQGLRQCPDWRSVGLPHKAMLATPAVWRGSELIAAPLAGNPQGWTARLVADFATFLKSD